MCDRSINRLLDQKIKLHFEILKLLDEYKKIQTNLQFNGGNINVTDIITINELPEQIYNKSGGAITHNMSFYEAAKSSFDLLKQFKNIQ